LTQFESPDVFTHHRTKTINISVHNYKFLSVPFGHQHTSITSGLHVSWEVLG